MNKKIDKTQKFVEDANKKFNNKFDYSKTVYINTRTQVIIICPIHGEFKQRPNSHLNSQTGCRLCGQQKVADKKLLSHDEYIKRCKKIHNNKYNYLKTKYVKLNDDVIITCPIHGDFEMKATYHFKQGCIHCYKENLKNNNKKEFLKKANKIHNNKYDYSKVNYVNTNTFITIICPVHGEFKQRPDNHLNCESNACPKCTEENKNKNLFESFKRNANKVHNNRYNYKYLDNEYVKVNCDKHGEFNQRRNNHLAGSGCPKCVGYISNQEIKIHDLLNDNNIDYSITDRKIISPSELDIVIPESNLAIEVNGVYWHSNIYKDKNYHLNKTIECNKKNVHLLHFWDYEVNNKFDIVSSMILLKCHKIKNKIYARKCEIREVSTKEAIDFQNDNHLQASIGSKVKLGLYFNDELVSLMTFGVPRFNKNYQWELLRFCSLKNTVVIGGASKLFKHFMKTYCKKDDKIISYANRRISNGNLYKTLGFNELKSSLPSYFYCKKDLPITRYQAQKHKLKKLLGKDNYDSNLTESENMENNGFLKIYDCGNLVFEYEV